MVELNKSTHGAIALHIVCLIIVTLAVLLRFLAKARKGTDFGWDDGCMLFAWATAIAYIGIVIHLLYLGSAQLTTSAITPEVILEISKFSYFAGIIFELANIAVKLSLLHFYSRIFTIPPFRRKAIAVGILCCAWFVASVLVTILQCIPVHKAWDQTTPGSCISLPSFILGYEVTNAALDITLICLPVGMIRNLKLGRRQKILISSIFMLGGFVCITSILRIIYLYHPNEPNDLFIRGPIWSTISISSAVLCGNLPLLKPLLTRSIIPLSIRNILYSWSTRSAGKQPSGSNIELQERGPYNPLGGEYKGVVTSPAEKNEKARDENRLNTISLTTTVDIE